MNKYLSQIPSAEVISPKSFGSYISTKIIDDATNIAAISLFLVIMLAYLCLRNIPKTAVALMPVISSIIIIFPIFAILDMKINAVALVACIVVTGLSIDYGIFSVTACDKNENIFSKDAFTALSLSVLSTAIGAAALLWAGHPALRTVGLVISSGVLTGYISAIYISPALYKIVCKTQPQKN
jgi:predicted exporter